MPYRELPNSDTTRLTALRRAKARADALIAKAEPLAFSEATQSALESFFPQFKKEYEDRQLALRAQTAATAALSAKVSQTRRLCSDYITVLNLAIGREEIPNSVRALYDLGLDDKTLPSMTTIDSVVNWAGRIVAGEAARVAEGGEPLSWPTAAQVEAALGEVDSLRSAQADASSEHDKEQEDLANLRVEADALIRDIWDEVEFAYRRDDAPSLRRKARLYGVTYATRPGEVPEEDPLAEEETPIASVE